MFQKIASSLAVALITAAFALPTTAEAGCGGGHKGFFKSSASYSHAVKKRKAQAAAVQRAKARKIAAAKKAKAAKLAAATKAKAAKLAAAKTESNFADVASTAALLTKSELTTETVNDENTEKTEQVAVLDTDSQDDDTTTCKRFVPAIGTTVSVSCE